MAAVVAHERAEMARQLAERDNLHRESTDRLLAQVALERAMWQERTDAADLRAEASNAQLADLVAQIMATLPAPAPSSTGRVDSGAASEPWWRRWFGTSIRSKVGR
jgi:hypothetical protein